MSQSYGDFVKACSTITSRWDRLETANDWKDVKIHVQYDVSWMRVSKPFPENQSTAPSHNENDDWDNSVEDENDLEALQKPHSNDETTVIYDIVHSPSYQVPVLYVTVQGHHLPSLDEISRLLMPDVHRPQLQAVGVMGAFSLTEHPITGATAFFVHPCRTTEAMQSVTNNRDISPEQYLVLWLGLVGSGVGLSVPIALAQSIVESGNKAVTNDG